MKFVYFQCISEIFIGVDLCMNVYPISVSFGFFFAHKFVCSFFVVDYKAFLLLNQMQVRAQIAQLSRDFQTLKIQGRPSPKIDIVEVDEIVDETLNGVLVGLPAETLEQWENFNHRLLSEKPYRSAVVNFLQISLCLCVVSSVQVIYHCGIHYFSSLSGKIR